MGYCTVDQVEGELPRVVRRFDDSSQPSLNTVEDWIDQESRWIDGVLAARGVTTLPVTAESDPVLLPLLVPVATWLTAQRILRSVEFGGGGAEGDRAEDLRLQARYRIADLPIAHTAAAAALLASVRLVPAVPAAVVAEASRRLAYYLSQAPPAQTEQSALRACGALMLLRPWRAHRAGIVG